jgi:hypothetical protein
MTATPKKSTQDWWNKRLIRLGLGMGRGTTSNLSYVGSSSELEFIAGAIQTDSGKVEPEGAGPDE